MINILIQEFAPKQTVADQNALEQFQKQWSTYQKLVDADALSHRAAGELLHDALCAIPTTFAIVDIACGDASQMREVLLGTKCRHYQGIDLSAPALELAAKNLASAPYELELDHEDFVEALTKAAGARRCRLVQPFDPPSANGAKTPSIRIDPPVYGALLHDLRTDASARRDAR